MSDSKRSGARRFWPLLVVVIVAAALLLYGRHQPVEVEADYVLTGERKDLVELHVAWSGDEGKTVSATFRFDERAPRIHTQALSLPPDRYDVVLQLVRNDGTTERIEHEVVIDQAQRVELRASEE